MMTAYRSSGTPVPLTPATLQVALDPDVVWVDLEQPTREEELQVERLMHIEVPTRDDLRDIEPSSRLYADENAIYLTASILCRADSPAPVLADVAFVLTPSCLVTVRYDDPKSFKLFAAALGKLSGGASSAHLTLARLLETIADRTAEILEQADLRGDALLVKIFGENGQEPGRRKPKELERLLNEISAHHRLIAKARGSLTTLSRIMTFLQAAEVVRQDREVRDLVKSISRDIQSLSEHAGFLSGNVTFLLDASLGLINVEQNAIIKIFSIASVVFLPPTLVASTYGMNFKYMPELDWVFGYPSSLVLMAISAIIPIFFFRWRGWL
ncbi:MAG: magnesium transporter CorA family protein [Rhizobium sp.]|nr:magnesium transporter CorA family protein [Rhizobium sp.]